MNAGLSDGDEGRTKDHQAKPTQYSVYYRSALVSTKSSRARSCDILDSIRLNYA